ncbi:glycine oxidase ThiO [Pistricoccus aurantiacus]|uniref:glycine oxidase ThiO n=1 Tax=Pistricoccus aurantiacus TaxID=1883414 RepID=UPI0036444284
MNDFLIIGGGVIGMMSAWQLADAGCNVTLIERGRCANEASWAGGGIVSPLYPWRHLEPISQLSRWSEGYYPALARQLIEETGIDPEYRQKGLLYLRVDDEAEAKTWAARMAKPLEQVSANFLYDKEPYLASGFDKALWMPTLGSIRNPRLGQALRARLASHSRVRLEENTQVNGFRLQRDRLEGVETSRGVFSAGRVVVCGGAWTGKLLKSLGVELPVRPVKGQMMIFRTPPKHGRMLVERVLLMDGRYLIPRSDGRLLIGSTLEEKDFDKSTTDDAKASLLDSAVAMVPELATCEIEHHWAGLRPGAPDGMPFIGAVPGIDGLFVNAGHYRNGLVLAPATTRLLVDQLLDRVPILDPEPFHLSASTIEARHSSLAG